MSQLGQVEQNKDRQEMSEAAASCEEPSASKNENEKSRDKFKKKKAISFSLFSNVKMFQLY